ncbi:MAG: glycosyltransferase family 2 protein, partial [Kineosporiaceae bacterium]
MSLDTGPGPGVALQRSVVDAAASEAADVDPYTGASRGPRAPVPAPPAALAPTGPVAPRPRVTAVLVCHDGEPRLARTLAAVAAQTRPADLLVAADTGSVDRSAAMLATATPHILRLTRRATFGDAVQSVLAALGARARPAPDPR